MSRSEIPQKILLLVSSIPATKRQSIQNWEIISSNKRDEVLTTG
jgi:hypothetical protein